jgi:hypothetical protein
MELTGAGEQPGHILALEQFQAAGETTVEVAPVQHDCRTGRRQEFITDENSPHALKQGTNPESG